MKRIIIGLLLFAAGVSATSTTAQTPTPNVRKEQCQQQHKIRHGVDTGQLTRKEAARLEMQQAKINHHKRMAKADGVVTVEERAIIKHEQRRADRNIARQKHDGETR